MSHLSSIVTPLLAIHANEKVSLQNGYSPQAIHCLVRDFYTLLFPQYTLKNLKKGIAETCKRVHKTLCQEIAKGCEAKHAEKISFALLEALPAMHAILKTDAEAAFRGDPAAKGMAEIHLSYPGFRAIAIHRIAHFLYQQNVAVIPRFLSEIVHSETGIDIHPGATIGGSFFIDHGTGVVIGETTIIGPRVKLYQGVTLGALSVHDRDTTATSKRHPTIEEEVTVYAGATILGGHTVIGKGSVIGGNVWLTQSVPPHTKILNKSPYLIYEDLKTGEEIKREEQLDLKI